ncbi:g5524 [Coccomyxa elongata]
MALRISTAAERFVTGGQDSDEPRTWARPDLDSARKSRDPLPMAGPDGRQESSSSEKFYSRCSSLENNVPEMLQRPAIKAASGGNNLEPDEQECMHTLGAALHRGLCLKDSYKRGVDSPVREFSEGGGSWGIRAGSGGGPTGRTGPPSEGGPAAAAASTVAKQLVPLAVPNEGDEAQEPALDTPAQIPAQQKQLRHGAYVP